jgi:C4-dicarboxylate transporter DctQ subunit
VRDCRATLARRSVQAAEAVAAAMLAAMFLAFLLQIGGRYLFPQPLGWTVELCLTLWLWLVFFAAAFCLRDRDHVSFDILYLAAGRRMQRLFAAVSCIAIIVGFAAALPADWDYVTFYRIKKSAILKIRLDHVFSIYIVFAVAVIAQYSLRLWRLWRADVDGAEDEGLNA